MKNKEGLSIRHHFLPKFYLNNFGTKNESGKTHIFVYEKEKKEPILNSVTTDSICYIKNFHTIDVKGKKSDIFEKMHDKIYENKYSIKYNEILLKFSGLKVINHLSYINVLSYDKYLEQLLTQANEKKVISQDDKIFLSQLLAYFVVRSPHWRNRQLEFYDKTKKIIEEMYRVNNKDISQQEIDKIIEIQLGTREKIKINHLYTMFDGKTIDEIADILIKHIWSLSIANSDRLIYTNDAAYGMTLLDDSYPKFRGMGFGTHSVMIYFPITPSMCITICERKFLENEVHGKYSLVENKALILNNENIEHINSVLYGSARSQIYSKTSYWDYENYRK